MTNMGKSKTVRSKKNSVVVKKSKSGFGEFEKAFKTKARVIESAFESTVKLVEKPKSGKKKLFEGEVPVFLQISAVKIPKCPARVIRIPLKHTLLTDASEICLIVPDVADIRSKEHDRVVEHYEEVLQMKNITNIKGIIPLNQLRTEYDTYEAKRKLVELYDVFLVDGKISGYVTHILGKIFMNKRKIPVPVKIDHQYAKEIIGKAVMKTSLQLHSKGDSFTVQVGHTKMGSKEVVENTFSVLGVLEKEFPGKWANIRSLHLKAPKTTGIPFYITMKSKSSIDVPIVKPKLPKAYESVEGELSTRNNTKVTVLPSGEIITERINTRAKKIKVVEDEETDDSGDEMDTEEENVDDESEDV